MEDSSLPPVIIIDNGSGYLKAGLSVDKFPSVTIPALVGRQLLREGAEIKLEPDENGVYPQYKELMIGDEVIPFRSLLELSHPVNEGIIKNPDDVEKLWEYALKSETKLNIEDLSDRKIIITEAPLNPLENKFIICELMFEKFQVGAINIEPQAKCSLFCEGLDTGIVLDSGDGVTHCIPISSGQILYHNIERMNIAGRHITEYMIRLMQKRGYNFNSSADFEFVRELKEKFCFVSNDIKGDRQLEMTTTAFNSFYLLPDGSRLQLSDEKFEAPEILFDPLIDVPGIHEITFKSINECPIDTRRDLYGNMVLSGGSTLFPGFASRIELEIKKLYKEKLLKNTKDKAVKISINVIDSPRRKNSVFLGASIIGNYYNTPESEGYWITNEEWIEKGCFDENDTEEERQKKHDECMELIKSKCQSYFKESYTKEKKRK